MRKQKPNESSEDYVLYVNAEKLRKSEYAKAYRVANPDKVRAYEFQNADKFRTRKKASNIKSKYGLTLAEYDQMLSKGCTLCGTHEGKLCCDHNHETGEVRGCLCNRCNAALGYYETVVLPMLDKVNKYVGGTL